jgi:hypothetical protein
MDGSGARTLHEKGLPVLEDQNIGTLLTEQSVSKARDGNPAQTARGINIE